jgi:DNA-binding SARP family transcriptional activator
MAMDPLRESTCRLVIEAHLSEGNRHEARRTAAGFRDRLRADSGMSPPPDLASLLVQQAPRIAESSVG